MKLPDGCMVLAPPDAENPLVGLDMCGECCCMEVRPNDRNGPWGVVGRELVSVGPGCVAATADSRCWTIF